MNSWSERFMRVIITTMVLYNANFVVVYEGRKPAWLPRAPLDMEYGNNIDHRAIYE